MCADLSQTGNLTPASWANWAPCISPGPQCNLGQGEGYTHEGGAIHIHALYIQWSSALQTIPMWYFKTFATRWQTNHEFNIRQIESMTFINCMTTTLHSTCTVHSTKCYSLCVHPLCFLWSWKHTTGPVLKFKWLQWSSYHWKPLPPPLFHRGVSHLL